MAWSPCPFKRFPGARQPDHQLPSWSHRSQAAIAPRATRVSCTPATTRETRHVRRTHHLYLGLGGRKLADISLSFYLSLSKRSLSFSFFSSSSSSRPLLLLLLLLLLLSPLSLSLALALARALSLSLSRSFALALARSLLIYLAYRARCFRSIFSTLLLISTRQTHLALSLSLSFFLSSTDVSRNFFLGLRIVSLILSASSFSFFYFSTVFFFFF